MVVHAAVQSEYESRLNFCGQTSRAAFKGTREDSSYSGSTCSGLFFFCSLEALRQFSVEGGLAAELLDHTRYRLIVRELYIMYHIVSVPS